MSQQGSGGDEKRVEAVGQGIPAPGAFIGGMPRLQMGMPGKLQRQPGRKAESLLLIHKLLIVRGTPNRGYTLLPLWKNQVKLSPYLL